MGVTRNDVARLAGVSPATVSYVVNNGPRPVSEETRQRVLRAIEQLGYRPSTIARSLKTKKTYGVGVVISDILNPILASIEKAVEDVLLQQGYSLTICNSDESPDRERILLEMLDDRAMDGIILLPTGANLNLILNIVREGRKLVLIDRQITELEADCVLFDNEAGAYEAVRHLVALGHTCIGLLNLPSSLTPGHGRLLGYQRALQDAGLPLLPQLVREGSFKAQEADILVTELLDASPRPTALLVSSNRLAQAVLREVKARNLRMPDDLALCVFDDVAYYAFYSPSITAVAADAAELGTRAAQFLIERINGTYTGEPRTALIPCRLQIRESTAGPAAVRSS
jgi:DNA-binding LacI/PurR family transcriptional regulator